MEHIPESETISAPLGNCEVMISIIDQDQEEDIIRHREKLMVSRKSDFRRLLTPIISDADVRKRYTDTYFKRVQTGVLTNSEVRTKCHLVSVFDLLSNNLLIEIFEQLPQLAHLLTVRQVCWRWYILSCNSPLWRTLSFDGQEHVTTHNLIAMFWKPPSLHNLRRLSLAKVHGVSYHAVRFIPRTERAATLESVDLSWCGWASDKSLVEFSRCPALRELRLSHCKMVSHRSIRILAIRCPRLEVLDMNYISGVQDSLLHVIHLSCPYLRILNIANAHRVTDEGILHVAMGFPRLEVLDLSWCKTVTDLSISRISENLRFLQDVRLSETRVTDVGISALTSGCNKLESFHLA